MDSKAFKGEKVKVPIFDENRRKLFEKATILTLKKHGCERALFEDLTDTTEDSDATIFVLTHVTESYRVKVQDEGDAFEIWTKLKNIFTKIARSRLAVLRSQLPSLKQSKHETST
jgi:hypothetical protein